MAHGFTRDGDAYVARFDETELDIVVSFLQQTRGLLESLGECPAAPPEPAPATEESARSEFDELMCSAGFAPGFGDEVADDSEPARSSGFDPRRRSESFLPDSPEDPALRRLLPDGHADDPLAAAEFRQYSQEAVRRRKIANLATAEAALRVGGGNPHLDAESAGALLVALTDVRLVLADRLGLRTEEDAEALEESIEAGLEQHRSPLILTYDFLTWLQETLAQALMA